jgi:hypothetical protein
MASPPVYSQPIIVAFGVIWLTLQAANQPFYGIPPSPKQGILLPQLVNHRRSDTNGPICRPKSFNLIESKDNATIPSAGETVIDSLRKVLADSHVAPVAIALLMGWSLVEGIDGLTPPIFYAIVGAILFLATAVAEREMPSNPFRLNGYDLLIISQYLPHLVNGATYAAAAWLLSQWVYGQGPIRCLRTTWSEIIRRSNVS